MRILRIVLLLLVVVIVVVGVVGLAVYNQWTRGPLPQLDGQVTIKSSQVGTDAQAANVSGLQDKVEVIRDNWGIPHIYASNPHDLFFAQGYSQAQDRWWQMEFSRHIGSGTIEELVGKNADVIGQDIFIRTVGWRRSAERDWASYDDNSKAALQAFADGVNAYILSRSPGQLAFEYNILGTFKSINIPIKPWTPVDSIVWGKVMAWDLSGNRDNELLRAKLYEKIGKELTDEFIPEYPFGQKPTILADEDLPISDKSLKAPSQSAEVPHVDTVLAGGLTLTSDLFRTVPGIGSNNWVISGSKTETGKPMLANDPHLGIQMPSIWYEVGLHCSTVGDACPYDVVGFALPAVPGVIIGHNARIAWGMTNVGPDTQDLYLLKINPENPMQYEWNGKWRDMQVFDETINFGDGKPPVTIKVRQTHLGPILNDNQIDEKTGEIKGFNNDDPMAFKWTTTAEPETLVQAILGINTARNWDEFRAAAKLFASPAQNLVYADVDGNIGYQTPGRIPIRAAGHTGLVPVDGTTDKYEWKGYIPFDNLPRILNPARGYIATANQAVVPLDYYGQLKQQLGDQFGQDANYFISQEWAYGYRAQRINDMLKGTDKHSIASIQAIQGDDKIISGEEIKPYLEKLDMGDKKYNDARDWMLNWDFEMTMNSQQAGLYGYFWSRLLEDTFSDQLGDVAGPDEGDQGMWAVRLLLDKPDDKWWDDVTTSDKVETRDDMLVRAFRDAYDRISKDRGDDRANWAWGKFHTATFVSNPLGLSGIGLIENIVNRGPVETAGGGDLVNATRWDASNGDGFTVQSLPSMRMIVDLNDLTKSVTMHTTGESGHPFSPHYGDMIDSWRNIQYHPMLWSRDQVEAAAASKLTLVPG
jgi:penicillin amidase